jgi:hypothetical protein
MVLPTTGNAISLSQVQTEMGGANPTSMSEYYANASSGYCTGITGIPNTGASISCSQFLGKSKTIAGNGLYTFSAFTFTNAGVTGRTGPILSQCVSAYSSASWASNTSYFNMTTQGIQLWTVPATGSYTLTVAGAKGGDCPKPAPSTWNYSYVGGNGRIVTGTTNLTQGQVLQIVTGQIGITSTGASGYQYKSIGSGGGGGTFVMDNSNGNPILIAGGGGGCTNDGMNTRGSNGIDAPQSVGSGTGGTATGGGGGGAGWYASGGDSTGVVVGGPTGGRRYTGGIAGRNVTYDPSANSSADGGFGGGGANCAYDTYFCGAGGGGGYSGGGGVDPGGGAGGASSYIGSIGSYGSTNNGVGYVTITPNFTITVAPLYTFSTFTFTNASATGRLGPILSACTSAYSGQIWASNTSYFNMTTQGIQLWTVPDTGNYSITVAGAGVGGSGSYGCQGIIIKGTLSLTKGQILKILVGQLGVQYVSGSSGGGGGSFVIDNSNNPLLIAGGGGGVQTTLTTTASTLSQGVASTTASGGSGSVSSGGSGGSGGGGSLYGSGGGGLTGNGTDGSNMVGTGKGYAFINGGLGGTTLTSAVGGFGCGGGTHGNNGGGGGGGGYSGGGGGYDSPSYVGGGGGSYGTYSTIGYNTGNGYVTITVLALYSFSTFTFTNASATGKSGPILSACRSAYSSASWAQDTVNNYLNMTTSGIQQWTVPATGSYTLAVAGAAGGTCTNSGGQGIIVQGTYVLNKGTVLSILVGQMGNSTYDAGGGGGTFVISGSSPLIVAGGGGGGASTGAGGNGIITVGDGSGATGGSDGSGGGNNGGGYSGNGSGGGGYTGGGGAVLNGTGYVNGGIGGYSASFSSMYGGFGGGGCGYVNGTTTLGAGGGGGYTGGAGQVDYRVGNSSGGGSYGTGISYIGYNSSQGYVTITPNFTITGPIVAPVLSAVPAITGNNSSSSQTYNMSSYLTAGTSVTWSLSGQPSGVSIDSSTGVITVTAGYAVSNTITVTATNTASSASRTFYMVMSSSTLAIDQGAYNTAPWNSAFSDTGARWIWNSSGATSSAVPGYDITFRNSYINTTGSSMSGTIYVCCDNELNVYQNGSLIFTPTFSGWNGASTSVTIYAGINTFDFVGYNQPPNNNPAGLIFSLRDSGSNVIMRSDNVYSPLTNTTYTSVLSSVLRAVVAPVLPAYIRPYLSGSSYSSACTFAMASYLTAGTGTITWTASGLPSGVTIASGTGVITVAQYNPVCVEMTVTATNSTGSSSSSVPMIISAVSSQVGILPGGVYTRTVDSSVMTVASDGLSITNSTFYGNSVYPLTILSSTWFANFNWAGAAEPFIVTSSTSFTHYGYSWTAPSPATSPPNGSVWAIPSNSSFTWKPLQYTYNNSSMSITMSSGAGMGSPWTFSGSGLTRSATCSGFGTGNTATFSGYSIGSTLTLSAYTSWPFVRIS